MVPSTDRPSTGTNHPRGPHALNDASRRLERLRGPARPRLLACIRLLSRLDEAAALERAAPRLKVVGRSAFVACTGGVRLCKATCSISSQRAAEGAWHMVPVFSGGRMG